MNYQQCLEEMFALRRFGIKLDLDVIRHILAGLGNPQDRFASIHIAGTNGKGSIAAAVSSILQHAGLHVGRYTSPHLVRFNERICINGRPIQNAAVAAAYQAVKKIHRGPREPTFFEWTTAMALYEFQRRGVDWAVIETGMGGRFDATNVIRPAVSIISNISLEHKTYLGSSIEKIAFEKSGIIKKETPVVTGVRQKKALAVVKRAAADAHAPLFIFPRDVRVRRSRSGGFHYHGLDHRWRHLNTNLAGRHQVDNAALALAAVELLMRMGLPVDRRAVEDGLMHIDWPGRLQIVSRTPFIILDGAHNLAAARHLARFLRSETGSRPVTLVIGILDDKPYRAMLDTLAPCCSRIVLTRSKIDRALDPAVLLTALGKRNIPSVIIHSVEDAVRRTIEGAAPDDVICIAGSLYVVGEAMPALAALGTNDIRLNP